MTPDIFTLNSFGLGSSSKLLSIIADCEKHSNRSQIICIQETKLTTLSNTLLSIIRLHNLEHYLSPANNKSGGLLTMWSKNLKLLDVVASNEACHILKFEHDLLICNTYLNPSEHVKKFELLRSTVTPLPLSNKRFFLVGDFNSFDHNSANSSEPIRGFDPRLRRHENLSQLCSDLQLHDCAVTYGEPTFTHYHKRTRSFARIDYIFANSQPAEGFDFDTFDSNVSDHRFLHLKQRQLDAYDRGQGYWKLNATVLAPNKTYLSEMICNFSTSDPTETYRTYHQKKNELRENLRCMSINKNNIEKQHDEWLEKTRLLLKNRIQSRSFSLCDIEEYDRINSIITTKREVENVERLKNFKVYMNECYNGVPKALKASSKSNTMNKISRLKLEDGSYTEDSEKILSLFRNFYTKVYTNQKKDCDDFESLTNLMTSTTDHSTQSISDGPITSLEVATAIKKLNTRSAPGPDGLSSPLYQFFQTKWSEVLPDVFNESIKRGKLPPGLNLAIIKLLPKSDNPVDINQFRPISLINTDTKILAHILAERLKVILSKLISKNQHAYLTGRQINVALKKIASYIGSGLKNNKCVMNIDFAKAFDTIDRDYIFAILAKIGVGSFMIDAVKTLYTNTKAAIEVNGFISIPITTQRGVRQGCPLSALLFIMGLDPLLRSICSSHSVRSAMNFSPVEAYADDVTCFPDLESVPHILSIVSNFSKCTQLCLNLAKTEILCNSSIEELKVVKNTKILGVPFNITATPSDLFQLTTTVISNHRHKLNLCITLKARAEAIDTFVVPKLMHIARHQNTTLKDLGRCQSQLLKIIFPNAKYDVKSTVLHQSKANGGINLIYLPVRVLTAKLVDGVMVHGNNLATENDPQMKKLLKHNNVKLEVDTQRCVLLLSNIDQGTSIDLKSDFNFRKVYEFILQAKFPSIIVEERLSKSSEKYQCTTFELKRFCKRIWKSNYLFPHEKNLFYRLAFNSIRDKQSKWLDNLVDSPTCSFCDEEFETNDHLIFACKKLETAKTKLNLKNWRDIFCKKLDLKHRFVSSVLFGSLKCTPSSSLNYIDYFLEMES